jgi:hypothetical protein
VLANDVNNKVSISIVPFNAQVNLGPTLRAQYNVTNLTGITNSNCIDLPTGVFTGPGISPALAMPQSGYFDYSSTTTQNANYYAPQAGSFPGPLTCKVNPANIVRLPSNNIATLQANLGGLAADGNTSITLGMKWGMAMLDPGSRQLYTNLINANQISANFATRPYNYNRQNTLKVIVVMTDGEHVASRLLNDNYRGANSLIYRSTGDGLYSIRHLVNRPAGAGANEYWWPHGCVNPPTCTQRGTWNPTVYNSGAGAPQLTWPQVWSQLRMSWVAQQLYARPLSAGNATARVNIYNSLMDPVNSTAFYQNSLTAGQMDTQLQASCAQARANGIVVFGVAFEAPANGQTQIYNCSSSPSHYYVANGSQINEAFFSIANQIQSLRLMQ